MRRVAPALGGAGKPTSPRPSPPASAGGDGAGPSRLAPTASPDCPAAQPGSSHPSGKAHPSQTSRAVVPPCILPRALLHPAPFRDFYAPSQTSRPCPRRVADRRQAAGADQHRRGQPRPPLVRCAEGRPRRHARPAGHRPAAGRIRRRDQDRAVRDGRHQDLPLFSSLRRGARLRRRRRADHRHHRCAADRCPDPRCAGNIPRRHHAGAAGVLRDQGRGRARLRPVARRRAAGAGGAAGPRRPF